MGFLDPRPATRAELNAKLDASEAAAKYAPARSALYDNTAARPNGTPAAFDSGQPLSLFGNAPLTISGGAYTHTTLAGANSAGYVQADMGPLTPDKDGIYHIGADVSWPTSDISAVAFVLSDEQWTDTPVPTRTVAKVHGVFYGNVMHVSTFNAPGETKYMDTSVASTDPAYVPKYKDMRGNAAFNPLDIQLDPETGVIVVLRPDGSAVTKTVPALVGFKPRYAIWELYEPDGTGIQSAKFKNLRASLGPRPVGGSVPTKADVGLIVANAAPQTFLLGSAVEYAPGTLDDIATPTGTAAAVKDGTLQITYTVPSTGNVQIDLDGTIWSSVATSIWWQLVRADTSGVVGNRRVQEAAGNGPVHATYRISGDTPGAVRTLKWFHVTGTAGPTLRCSGSEGRVANMRVTPIA